MTMQPTPNSTTPTLLTVKQFCERHKWATEGGLRSILFHRETNGFKNCIVRMGRKILLDEAEVFEWLRQQGD